MDRINGARTVDIGGGARGFQSRDDVAGTAGTEVTDAWLNGIQEELVGLILAGGLTLDGQARNQVMQSIARHAAGGAWFGIGGGAANAQTVTAVVSNATPDPDIFFAVPDALFAGMAVEFLPSVDNTGATTLDVFGLGVKPAQNYDGTAFIGGELITGRPVRFSYAVAGDAWRLAPWARPEITRILQRPFAGFFADHAPTFNVAHDLATKVTSWGTVVNTIGAYLDWTNNTLTVKPGGAGFYDFGVFSGTNLPYEGTGDWGQSMSINVNGVSEIAINTLANTSMVAGPFATAARPILLAEGDAVEFLVKHNYGSTLNYPIGAVGVFLGKS